jgi:hypothetical protein
VRFSFSKNRWRRKRGGEKSRRAEDGYGERGEGHGREIVLAQSRGTS